MKKNLTTLLKGLGLTTSAGMLAVMFVASPAAAQSAAPTPATKEATDAAKDTAKDAPDAAKQTGAAAKKTAQDAQDVTKDASKDAGNDAKDATESVRDTAKETSKDARNTTKQTTKDARETVKETGKDARDTARDTTRETGRDVRRTGEDVRDTSRTAPRDARDTTRDVRDTARDTRDTVRNPRVDQRVDRDARDDRRGTDRDDARVNSRTSFNVNTFRSADMGLWFRSANNGLVIADVASSGPIARLGFREGDRVVSVNGQRVTRERDFIQYLYADDVRTERVKVIVLRDDREEVIYLEPNVFIEETQVVHRDPLEDFGIIVDDRYDDQILVWKVIPRTPAYYAGIRAGDVITVFNGQPVNAPKQFVTLVQKVDNDAVQVEVNRNRQVRKLDVEFADRNAVREENIERRDDRREIREERREERRDVPREGARIDVDAPRGTATPRVDVDVNGANTPTPRVDVNVNPQNPPRGGILPRIRGR